MVRKIIYKFYKAKYLFLFFFLINSTLLNILQLNNIFNVKASEIDKTINNQLSLTDQIVSQYILDSGDSILINFIGISRFNGVYTINSEGNIILPEINRFYAKI